MSGWDSLFGSGGSGGAKLGRQFTGGGSGSGSYNPVATASPGTSGGGGGGYAQMPGVVTINPLDPANTVQQSGESIGQTLEGLKAALFGTDKPDARGIRGGIGAGIIGQGGLGDIPVVGDLLRGASMLPGAAATLASGVWDTPGDLLERIGPDHPGMSDEQYKAELQRQFDAIPADDPAKIEAMKALSEDKGILGTGVLDKHGHIMSYAIRDYEKTRIDKTNLFAGMNTMPGSVADTINVLWDGLGASARLVQRGVAGMEKPGSMGMNQLQVLQAVDEGRVGFTTGNATLNPVEQIAVDKVKSGEWTDGEALDFLSSHGAGYSHNQALQIAGEVALDPLNLATFGAGAVAKAGVTGARLLATTRRAESALAAAEEALTVAREARAAATTAKAIKVADAAVSKAETARDGYRAVLEATSTYRSALNAPARANILGRTVGRSESATNALKAVGKFYESSVQGTALGKGAKVIRTIIDPLHAMGGIHTPGSARGVDLTSDLLAKAAVDTLGPTEHLALLNHLAELDLTGQLADEFSRDFAVAMANRGREGVATLHQASQLLAGFGDRLKGPITEDIIEGALKAVKKGDLVRWLKEDVAKNTKIDLWDDAAHKLLARQMANLYHTQDEATWLKDIVKMSAEKKSFLKAAIYGRANRALIEGITHSAGHASAAGIGSRPLKDLILVAKSTLTRLGADSLLAKLDKARPEDKAALIREWQAKYPQLRYVFIDPHNEGRSITQFVEYVKNNLERLPMQVTRDEVKQLHPELQDLAANLDEAYTLGFKPRDEFLWGIERSNLVEGEWRAVTAPFVDHVADGGLGYRASRAMRVNIVGHPLLTENLRNVLKPIDYIEAGARVMKSQITGGMIANAAQKKFVAQAVTKYGDKGMTEPAAQRIWERIQEFSGAHKGYSGPRGFSGDVLWNDLREQKIMPKSLNPATGFGPRETMQLVLDAYDGDLRFIGLTQKLTARAKAALHQMTGSNALAEVAEHAWPTMKFRLNPIFQLQEKIEGWVLNAARGIHGQLLGPTLSDADLATQSLLQKMVDQSLVSLGDVDQAEFSAAVMFGELFQRGATVPGSAMAKIKAAGSQIMNVQGVKRVNMLRTFQSGLGKELRSVWETSNPGVWDDMLELASLKAGRSLNEDEFALQLISEQMLANDVFVSKLNGAIPDFANAIKPGVWHAPTTLGELKALDLDHVAKAVQITGVGGKPAETLADLRRAIAAAEDGNSVITDVADGLRRFGADPDYIARVENALKFSWTGFWQEATARFSLTADEATALQDFMARAAAMRGMTPVDFMSQVFSPGILKGQEGLLGDLSKPLDLLRKSGDGRAAVAGEQGVSTVDDLVRQLSTVFASHLDPSAKRALLMEFRPELRKGVIDGKVQFDLAELDAMWDSEAENMLADRILGYMNGETPTAAPTILTEARGAKRARTVAAKYQSDRGVTPGSERRLFGPDDALGETTAKAYSALPEVPYAKTGLPPTSKQISEAGHALKPQPAGVDDRTYAAFQDFVDETEDQFAYITRPRAKGGLGVKITVSKKERPYESAKAMAADIDKGHLSVYAGESDHPLMTNAQVVRFRATHLVFGHGVEGYELGPMGRLNAAAAHAPMYSDTARAAFLTETHGQSSWMNYSDDLIPDDSFHPGATYEEAKAKYEAAFPEKPTTVSDFAEVPAEGGKPAYKVRKTYVMESPVGPGFDDLARAGGDDAEEARNVINDQIRLRHEFGGTPVKPLAIDVVDILEHPQLGGWGYDAYGLSIGTRDGKPVALIDLRAIGAENRAKAPAREAFRQEFAKKPQGTLIMTEDGLKPKRSALGAPYLAGPGGAIGTARHELWHNIDSAIRYGPNAHDPAHLAKYESYFDFVERFTAEDVADFVEEGKNIERPLTKAAAKAQAARKTYLMRAREQLSEYAFASDEESMAELGVLISDPTLDRTTLPKDLQRALGEFDQVLNDAGIRAPSASPNAGKSVRSVNLKNPDSVKATAKAGLLPQELLDEFGKKFVGRGKHIESNPDVARAAQMFGKWTTGVLKEGILKGEDATHARLLQELAGMPTMDAVPYNLTEALTMQMATEAMQNKWRDAFRLQYFAQSRTMLERSINHPMFGIYPASYMFGKLGPEVIRFLALNPFGLQHGGMARTMMDVQAGITMQRQFDPEFDAKIEKLGHSQAMSWLGYMLPTLPWDVSASFPIWARDIAAQGLGQQQIAQAGGVNEPTNLLKPAVDTAEKLNPLTTTLPWLDRAATETLFSEPKTPPATTLAQNPVQGLELGPTLSEQMDALRNALAQ